jgi:MHS family alpha-ketoglutarate permease-like MFS transporter
MSVFPRPVTADSGPAPDVTSRSQRLRVIVGAGVGNALEWFDWTVYAIFAPFFAAQFFNPAEPLSALLSTLAVFAVGFLMRPLGGLFFGWLADRHGRRRAMTLAMVVTAVGSLLIGIAPTYGAVGVLASVVLLVARLAQGFGLGGEIGGSHTYLAEMAPPARRGLWASSMYVAVTTGTLTATLLAAGLSSLLGPDALASWGWRLPFLLGGLLGVYAIYLRRSLAESHAFERERAAEPAGERTSLMRAIWANKAAALRVIGLTVGGTVAYYTWAVSATGYAISVKGVDPQAALWAGVVANVVYILALPLWGALSDRWGRKPNVVVLGVGLGVLSFPLNWMIQGEAWQLAVAMSVALFVHASVASIVPAIMAEQFPTRIRASGFAFPYSIAVALTGGTAPYLQTWLAGRGLSALFIVYSIALLAVTLATVFTLRETKGMALD